MKYLLSILIFATACSSGDKMTTRSDNDKCYIVEPMEDSEEEEIEFFDSKGHAYKTTQIVNCGEITINNH